MKKKLLTLLLTSAIVISAAACGTADKPSQEAEPPAPAATDAPALEDISEASDSSSDIDTSEHVVITYMTTGDTPSGTKEKYEEMMEQLNAILTEKVNAELDINFISWTDYLSNYNLTLARMDGSVDLIGTATDWLDAWPNVKNSAFLPLSEDMLKTYAPKTWESVSSEHWDMCKYGGEIYLMPEDNYAQWTNQGFCYRLDWAKEAGLENGVHSWVDMTTYFKYVKENNPNMILWDAVDSDFRSLATGWIYSHSDYVSIDGISSGGLWGGTTDDPYTVYSPFLTETDSLVEFAKAMKEWDELGVWRTDVLNNKNSSNRDDYRIGKVAAEQHHTQTWTNLVSKTSANKIYETDPDAETGFFYFGEETDNVVALSVTHGAMAISAASKNPERALMVYDLLRNDPECYKLFCYGIQGVSWDINEDGLRITPEGYNQDTDNINGTTNFWWGRNDDLEIRDANRDWDKIDAMYEKYDQIKIDYPYGQFIPNVEEIQSYISNISEIHTSYMKQIAFGKYNGTAEDIVAEYQESLKAAGIEEVTAELQKQMDELYK